MSRFKKYIFPCFISLLIFLLSFSCLFYFYTVSGLRKFARGETREDWMTLEIGRTGRAPVGAELFGLPNSLKRNLLRDNYGITLTDTTYTLNDWAVRDELNELPPKKNHLIVNGCSFAFSLHVPYEKMTTSLLREWLPDSNVRNLSWPGGALNTSIRYLEQVDLTQYIPEPEGLFVYVFIPDHVNRWIRTPNYMTWAPPFFPYYISDSSGIKYGGKLGDLPEWKASWKRKDIKYEAHTPEGIKDFVRGMVHLRNLYLKQYPRGRFVWFVHPIYKNGFKDKQIITELAKKENIELVSFEDDFKKYSESEGKKIEDYQVADTHPNAEGNAYLAQKIRELF